MADLVKLSLKLNGRDRTFEVPSGRRLLDLIREDAGLTGTKEGCGAGECGACTVLLNGKPVTSCLVLAHTADGHEVTTVEGLAPTPGELHPFQNALVEGGGVQCGFCTPGVAVTGAAVLMLQSLGTQEQARLMSGNLCRCTGYTKILAALTAAREDDRE